MRALLANPSHCTPPHHLSPMQSPLTLLDATHNKSERHRDWRVSWHSRHLTLTWLVRDAVGISIYQQCKSPAGTQLGLGWLDKGIWTKYTVKFKVLGNSSWLTTGGMWNASDFLLLAALSRRASVLRSASPFFTPWILLCFPAGRISCSFLEQLDDSPVTRNFSIESETNETFNSKKT